MCSQTPDIYKLLGTILELVLWNDYVHYEGFNRIPFLQNVKLRGRMIGSDRIEGSGLLSKGLTGSDYLVT